MWLLYALPDLLIFGIGQAAEVPNMPRINKSFVESLPTPEGRPSYAWDDKVSGFGVKVVKSGNRKYVLKYRTHGGRAGRQRLLGLGTHGAVTAEQARALAQRALAAVAAERGLWLSGLWLP